MIRSVPFYLLFVFCLALTFVNGAQAVSALDGFHLLPAHSVDAAALNPNGTIIAAVKVKTVGGLTEIKVVKILPSGEIAQNFQQAECNGTIKSILLTPEGLIVLGGDFTEINGVERYHIAWLKDSDGSLETSFHCFIDGPVNTLARQPDGKILVGGQFAYLDGAPCFNIGRLEFSGMRDTSFNLEDGANGSVEALAIDTNGRILVGGQFTELGGKVTRYFGRLNGDGSLDTSLHVVIDAPVYTITTQKDGNILFGGNFLWVNGNQRAGLARITAAGLLDASVDVPLDTTKTHAVRYVKVQPDGRIVFAGDFCYREENRFNLARLTVHGTTDDTFYVYFDYPDRFIASALVIQPDGKILIGEARRTEQLAIPNGGITRFNPDGSLDTSLHPTINQPVFTVASEPDYALIAAGPFTDVNGTSCNGLVRFKANGDTASCLASINGTVYAVALQKDGKILIGGSFTSVNGLARTHFARLDTDGTVDKEFSPVQLNNAVASIAVQPDGKVLLGGDFTTVNGVPGNHLARVDSKGIPDTAFNTMAGTNAVVLTLGVQPDGKILVGGRFSTLNGNSRSYIGRLQTDGSLDATFTPTLNGVVSALSIQKNGNILIGGDFVAVNSLPHQHFARLEANGTVDNTLNVQANAAILTIAQQENGGILLGGHFTMLGGETRQYIARLNTDSTLDQTFNPGANNFVTAIAVQNDGKVAVSGNFTQLGGQSRTYLGRLSVETPALQELATSSDARSVTWLRSGSGPMLDTVRFLSSQDGLSWGNLGDGERIDGGWQLKGLKFPGQTLGYIKAIGSSKNGLYSGSGSRVEAVRQYYFPSALPLSVDANGDGSTSLADAILVLSMLAGNGQAGLHADADVNSDNRLGVAEAVYVLRKLAAEE